MSDVAVTRDKVVETVTKAAKALEGVEALTERMATAEKFAQDIRQEMREHTLAREAEYVKQFTPSEDDEALVRAYGVDGNELTRDRMASHKVNNLKSLSECAPGAAFVGHSDSEIVVRMEGCEQHGMYRPGLLDDPHPKTAWQAELQHLVELRSIAKQVGAKRTANGNITLGATPKLDMAIAYHLRRAPKALLKVFADNAGEGAEFTIPSLTMPETYRTAELPREVAALFPVVSLSTGDSTKNPFQTRGLQPFIMEQPASGSFDPAEVTGSVPTTSEVSVTPKTVGVSLPANRDAAEDAIMAFAPMAQRLVAEAIRDAREDALINGDAAATHGDSGLSAWNPRSRWHSSLLGTSLDHRKWFTGLRHQAIDASATQDGGSAQTPEGLAGYLANLDSPHAFDSVVYIMSPEFFLVKMLVDDEIRTVDKFGPAASILTGQVAAIYGRPIVLSEFVDKEYNASGVYDDSTKTKTGTLIVNRSRMYRAVRRSIRVESEVVARSNTNYTVASVREGFGRQDPSSTKSVVWVYNQDPS